MSPVEAYPEEEPASVPLSDDDDTEPFHPDFASTSAEFIIRSSDEIRFRVHQALLQQASPVFSSMLSLPQPDVSTSHSWLNGTTSTHDTGASLDLPENSTTIASLLRITYPFPLPSFEDLEALAKVMFAAEKYDMLGALSTLRRFLLERQYLITNPVHVYALARRFGWKAEAHLASRFTLVFDVHDSKYLPIFAATGLSTQDLFALFSLRHKRIQGMINYLEGDDFEGNAPGYACQACGKTLNDTTWPFLKATVLKEMYRRPLGDELFGSAFLKTKAVGAFLGGKCGDCGELSYDKGFTLSKIKAHLDQLPACACESCEE